MHLDIETSRHKPYISCSMTTFRFESVLFGCMIGVGCDYVLHFSCAYHHGPEGNKDCKEDRTLHALVHLGPSVLGSAFTTGSTGAMMLFAENLYMYKFGMMLTLTVLHSVIGSFVLFVVLCDCFGSSKCNEELALRDNVHVAVSRFKSFLLKGCSKSV